MRAAHTILEHDAAVVWFTGFSGSGKSTIATALHATLTERCVLSVVLDGDVLREGLCSGLGFSDADRAEAVRRASEAALIFAGAGFVVLCALVSPFRAGREAVRAMCRARKIAFLEVHVSTPLEVCEGRDVKGHYARARAGDLPMFTGIGSRYEVPAAPEIIINAAFIPVAVAVESLLANILGRV
jgi:adenylylsulfate kinase